MYEISNQYFIIIHLILNVSILKLIFLFNAIDNLVHKSRGNYSSSSLKRINIKNFILTSFPPFITKRINKQTVNIIIRTRHTLLPVVQFLSTILKISWRGGARPFRSHLIVGSRYRRKLDPVAAIHFTALQFILVQFPACRLDRCTFPR